MADKIVVMQDGIVEQIGAPLDLYDKPANQFVAGFIGSPSMNFIEGRVRLDGTPRFETADGIALPVSPPAGVADGQPAVYGVRPEHMQIDPNGVTATVLVTEPTGAEILVVARIGQHEVNCLFRERLSFSPGETIRIAPQRHLVHLFDAQTGKAL
jgi:multiple sugar transport system ATP-binding protein